MSDDLIQNDESLSNESENVEQEVTESAVEENLSTDERIARLESTLKKSQKTQKNYRSGINRVQVEKDQLREELAALKAQNEQLLAAFQQSGQSYYAQQPQVDAQTQVKSWVKEAITDTEVARNKQTAEQREKSEAQEALKAFQQSVDVAADKYDDYYDLVPNATASQALNNELFFLPNAGFVQYKLASNPVKLAEFNEMPQWKVKRELVKFARKCEGWEDDNDDSIEIESDSSASKKTSSSSLRPVGSQGKPVRMSKKDFFSMSQEEKVDFLGLGRQANRK
jgi:hypothetical protein